MIVFRFMFRFQIERLALLVFGFLLTSVAAAEMTPPINDNFSGRIQIGPGNIVTNGTMLGSRLENGEWLSNLWFSRDYRSVWWEWIATNSGPVTISVDAAASEANALLCSLTVEVSEGDSLVQLNKVAFSYGSTAHDGEQFATLTFDAIEGRHYVIGLTGMAELSEYTLEVTLGLSPMVVLDSPPAGVVFKAGDSITLSAQVLDRDSPVSHVTFYSGWRDNYSTLSSVQKWPYTLNWSNAPPGHYQIVARGWDTTGLSSFSLPVTIEVVPKNDAFTERVVLTGASVDVTGSLENASREEGEPLHVENELGSIWWSWTAPTNGFTTVSSDTWGVAVYTGLNLASLTLVTNGLPDEYGPRAVFSATAGTTYAIAAIGAGEIQLSLRMSQPPMVTILSPANGARFTVGKAIPVSVSAQDPDGALASLEVRAESLETNVSSGLFTTVLSNLPVGGYVIWATATDADGLSTRSSLPFQIEPVPIPPPLNDHYTNRFTLTGAPLIVTGTTVNATTELGEGRYHTIWWRWVAPASGLTTVTFDSSPHDANIYTGDAASVFECVRRPSIFCWRSCEVFQAQAGVAYQIQVYQHVDSLPPGEVRFQILQSPPPTVTLIGPTNGSHFILGESVQLSATVAGLDWGISKVEFFSSSTLLGTLTNEPYTVPISFQTDQNTRDVYAVVTDTMGWTYRSESFFYIIDPVPPANDRFAARTQLIGFPLNTVGSTENATRESDEPGPGLRTVWYTWVAPTNGEYTITLNHSPLNQSLFVYTGDVPSTLVPVAQSTNRLTLANYRTEFILNAVAGVPYQLAVVDTGGPFKLSIYSGLAPRISITLPENNASLSHGQRTSFEVEADDLDGDLERVDFYLNLVLLATVTSPPFSVEFAAHGLLTDSFDGQNFGEHYFLDAVATDRQGLSTAVWGGGDINRLISAAPNDDFANRIQLKGLLESTSLRGKGTTSLELGESNRFEGETQGSTWWGWHAPASGEVTVHCNAPFGVLMGQAVSVADLSEVATSQTNEWTHVCRFSAEAGVDYYFRVVTDYPTYRLEFVLIPSQPALLTAEGFDSGAMRLNFQTLADLDWTFQFSDNLRDWTPFRTNRTRLQNFQVIDPAAPTRSRRFYRAVSER